MRIIYSSSPTTALAARNFRCPQTLGAILGARRADDKAATCPECGGLKIRRIVLDTVDRVSKTPWNFLQRILGGKLFHCRQCRLQFYDTRKVGTAGSDHRTEQRVVYLRGVS